MTDWQRGEGVSCPRCDAEWSGGHYCAPDDLRRVRTARNALLIGRRVRLVSCTDEWTKIAPGTLGTINLVDDAGTVFVTWDDGSGLGMVPGHDVWEFADD